MAAAAAVPLAAGLTGYSIFSSERARKDAKAETKDMKAKSDAQNAEYLQRQQQDLKKRSAISMGLRRSLMTASRGGNDRGGTILTSPLGLSGGKTVLGS